ncbi:MAG: hypothetical protein QOH74_1495 [Gaiellales bacterium]|jgi:hypothetical protein|nr:hypothetical protein [Gaiellales bacterium]
MGILCMLAGTMAAGLRATQEELWNSHKRCPGCRASMPRGKHAENCEFKDRL